MKGFEGNVSVVDLGSGINGLSHGYFKKEGLDVDYTAVEAVGQLVNSMNDYFSKNKINGNAFHLSLFDLAGIIELIKKQKKPLLLAAGS